jgi:hypothetical protein
VTPIGRLGALALLLGLALAACAGAVDPGASQDDALRGLDAVGGAPAPSVLSDSYLQPNIEDRDGTPAYVHVTPPDMPLRVAIGYPQLPPRFGSREDGRNTAIEAMRQWERALQPHLPWFRLEFIQKDAGAQVQVVWKRRIAGPYAGFGGLRYRDVGGVIYVGGQMQISTSPSGDAGLESRIRIEEIPVLVAHEFGHVLGLGHCLDCDAAMNYSWATRGRVIVSEADVKTFRALVAIPNGTRVDGRLMDALIEDAPPRSSERGQ